MAVLLRYANKNPKEIERIFLLYEQIVNKVLRYYEGLEPLPKVKKGRQKKRIGHNLLIRLSKYKADFLGFLIDPNQLLQTIRRSRTCP
jgi:transposase